MLNINEKILFILNPISGGSKSRRKKIRYEIIQQLRKKKIDGEIKYSKYAGHTSVIAREALVAGYKYVVVFGGDGSINEVAKVLVNTDVAMGIIPGGSGNGLARALKIPFEIKKAMNMFKKKKTKLMDCISVNGVLAASIAGIGFDANTAYNYSLIPQRGFSAYFKSILKEYRSFKSEKIDILHDGKKYSAEIFLIVFANSNQFGFNFKIAPHANCFDGLLDITTVKPFPIIAAPFSAIQIFTGHAENSLFINNFQCKELTIIRQKPGVVNIDGDPIEMGNEINVKILEKSLRIFVNN